MAGRFITFEGGEGAGKSTQIGRLQHRLERLGQPVLATREPGGSPYAEEIRSFILSGQAKRFGPLTEALLFAAARIDHLDKTILPALNRGTHVLCDRFADSTRVYQGSLGRVDAALIEDLERIALKGVKPDLTLILDLPAETGLARAGERRAGQGEGTDRFEEEDVSFHRSLREAFLAIGRLAPDRCVVIDADRGPDDVEAAVWAAVRERLPDLMKSVEQPLDVA